MEILKNKKLSEDGQSGTEGSKKVGLNRGIDLGSIKDSDLETIIQRLKDLGIVIQDRKTKPVSPRVLALKHQI